MEKSDSSQEILKTVQWVTQDPASSELTPYPPDVTVLIEQAWKLRREQVDVTLDNELYTVEFEKMQELNKESMKFVKVYRKLLEEGDLENLPGTEEISLVNVNQPRISQSVHPYYDLIPYHMTKTIAVEKLMNRLLYNQYKLKKASVLKRATYPEVERKLYHGTSEASVKEICVHGFNRSFSTVYGQGVYFAINSALSVQDQYSPPNSDGYKFIFVSRVLTGDFTIGCHTMKTAPLMQDSADEVPLRYDSVTDNLTNPTLFVIFNDTQAFPEYLITCQQIFK
uniref:Poly [ADP-ribose] polymerase n=1 Tax=Cynoglossus semilaevis TaxID=244447 RepID=A0A3P8W3G3_CYNSE